MNSAPELAITTSSSHWLRFWLSCGRHPGIRVASAAMVRADATGEPNGDVIRNIAKPGRPVSTTSAHRTTRSLWAAIRASRSSACSRLFHGNELLSPR